MTSIRNCPTLSPMRTSNGASPWLCRITPSCPVYFWSITPPPTAIFFLRANPERGPMRPYTLVPAIGGGGSQTQMSVLTSLVQRAGITTSWAELKSSPASPSCALFGREARRHLLELNLGRHGSKWIVIQPLLLITAKLNRCICSDAACTWQLPSQIS